MIAWHRKRCGKSKEVHAVLRLTRRMKALRFHLIALPGRVVRHAREMAVKLADGTAAALLCGARRAILALSSVPDG